MSRGRNRGRNGHRDKHVKPQSWESQFAQASLRTDLGAKERWGHKIGIELVDEQMGVDAEGRPREEVRVLRRDSMKMLVVRDRVIDGGGRVIGEGGQNEFEHQALDTLLKFGILDDPAEPRRAKWRHKAGLDLLDLWIAGKRSPHTTHSYRAVGGGGRGAGISQEEAESIEARAESRYLRALNAVMPYDDLIHDVCCGMVVPAGAKRRELLAGLDLLAEFLNRIDPPAGTVRPKRRQH